MNFVIASVIILTFWLLLELLDCFETTHVFISLLLVVSVFSYTRSQLIMINFLGVLLLSRVSVCSKGPQARSPMLIKPTSNMRKKEITEATPARMSPWLTRSMSGFGDTLMWATGKRRHKWARAVNRAMECYYASNPTRRACMERMWDLLNLSHRLDW